MVGFAGRFVEEKGFDVLLRAVPALAAAEPDVHLVYAGEHEIVVRATSTERCRPLRRGATATALEPFVGLLRDRQRLADFYALCDVFALPSRTDCFAAVQVEAMLCGTPVVATDIPGARDGRPPDGHGPARRAADPDALAAGLVEVLSRPRPLHVERGEIRAVFDRRDRSIERRYEALLDGAPRDAVYRRRMRRSPP